MARKTMLIAALTGATALGGAAWAQTTAVPPEVTPPAPAGTAAVQDAQQNGDVQQPGEGERADRGDTDGGHDGKRGAHGDRNDDARRRGGMMFLPPAIAATLDENGDGEISSDEADAGIRALVTQHDANGDGVLQFEEFESLQAALLAQITQRNFNRLDRNGDGTISADEAAATAPMLSGARVAPAGSNGSPVSDGTSPAAEMPAPTQASPSTPEAPASATSAPATENAPVTDTGN